MRTIQCLAALTALTCFSLSTAPAAPAQQQPLRGFDAYVAKAMTDWRVPGMAVVVVKDDSVAFIKGYGVRELGKPERVTVHTRFGNMSTTKAFTALLIAMLADSGRLAFDDPVQKHLPALQLADPYVTREVTIRDLLTHRIGFGDPEWLWRDGALDLSGMIPRLRFVPATSSFRSRLQYNNVGYGLLGEIAARAAGGGEGGGGGGSATWQSLMRRRIYAPLGMTESYPDGAELLAAGISDVTAPHGIVRDTVRVLPVAVTVVDPVPAAGSAFTSATDMGKWLRFLLDSGKVAGRRLVSAANFAQLLRPQQILARPFYPTASLTRPHFQAYGLGWILQDYRGEFVALHTGSIEGRSAIVGLLPDRRVGVAVLTNLDHSELRHALMYAVFDRYIGTGATPARDWSAELRAMYRALADTAAAERAARESKRVTGTRPTMALDRYTGTYSDSLFGTAMVGLNDGSLTLQLGKLKGRLEHWQYDVFRLVWEDPFWETEYLSFTMDPDGTVGAVRFVDGEQVYARVKSP